MVSPVNAPPTEIALDTQSISENAALGSVIGRFFTTDLNSGDSFTYSLVFGINSSGNGAFRIDGDRLLVNRVLDYETLTRFDIRVRSTDAAGAWIERNFIISILDGNDAPTALSLSTTSVVENLAAGGIFGTLTTTDPNAGNTFTYTLVSGNGATDNAAFRIEGNQLRILSSPNFEAKSSYSIRVRSVDQGGMAVERAIALSITNQNEAPTDVALNPQSIVENAPPDTVVGTFTTVDPDTGDQFTYSLLSEANTEDNRLFRIVGNQLRILTPPDFETKNSYRIAVRSTDQNGLFTDKTFTIGVQDVQDSIPTSNSPMLDLNGAAAGINSTAVGTAGIPTRLLSNSATLTDDNLLMTSALVVISNPVDGASEVLSFDPTGTNVQATVTASGVLNLSGVATVAQYLQVLRTVTYNNTAVNPNPTSRTILFLVNDGSSNSQVASVNLSFRQVNTVNGSEQSDNLIVTSSQQDVINGRGGDDAIATHLEDLLQTDSIDGGTGVDTLTILSGEDTLRVEVAQSNQLLGLTPGSTVTGFERFDLSGFTGSAVLNGSNSLDDWLRGGTGNDSLFGNAGNDTLGGNAGNDFISGGFGADRMEGGDGSDTYEVDSEGDVVVEMATADVDTVRSTINYSLGGALENLTLVNGAVMGIGNSAANVLRGNAQNNLLRGQQSNDQLLGGAGNDTLSGGRGADTLHGRRGNDTLMGGADQDVFVLAAAAEFGQDTLTDFDPLLDTIQFERTGFLSRIALGNITVEQFHLGSGAADGGDRFIYNTTTGVLFFDPDGTGSLGQIQIATLQNRAALEARHISVVAEGVSG